MGIVAENDKMKNTEDRRIKSIDMLGRLTNITLNQILDEDGLSNVKSDGCRKTKIVCTIGPSCIASTELILQMIDNGMNVCRLNFSHGDHKMQNEMLQKIREAQKLRPNVQLSYMLDTKGPEIRTGLLKDHKPIKLVSGQRLKIVIDYNYAGDENTISCSYSKLLQSVQPGNIILISDGSVSCKVLEILDDGIITTVLNSATLGERKNMNLPKVKVELPCIGEKDIDDILNFAIPNGFDFIAASFVQSAADVMSIRDLLGPRGRNIKIISKIENVEGLINFDEILKVSDGIMVARGDLGMEIFPEKVFLAQKLMISKCNLAGKPVITATQMLESMTNMPRPTRAECADVANAVLDGSDCVMLSGETANGSFPVQAVDMMARVCVEAEKCIDYENLYRGLCFVIGCPISTPESVARAAVETALSVNATAILVLTETGDTARLIAKYRPRQQILAVSASASTVRQLSITRGITSILVSSFQGTDHVINSALRVGKERKLLFPNDLVVAVHGIREEVSGGSNLLKVVVVDGDQS